VNSSLVELQQQWRENQRLRLGALLICIIMAVYTMLLLSDYRDSLLAEYSRQQTRLLKIKDLQHQPEWIKRAEQARAWRVQQETQLWNAESKGLAQAKLQSWFNRQQAKLNLTKLNLDTELAEQGPAGSSLWQVSAELKGRLSRNRLIELLKILETHKQRITIEQFKLTHARNSDKLDLVMQLRAWFLPVSEQQKQAVSAP